MPKYLQISIPESCRESWNEMQPNNQGRHCFSCQKTVVDFTHMTDAELISFFKKDTRNTCGRFTNDQLQRDILIPKKKIHWAKYFLQVALPAFLLSIKPTFRTFAQKQTSKATVEPVVKKRLDSIPEIIAPKVLDIEIASANRVDQVLSGKLGIYEVAVQQEKKVRTVVGKVVDEKGEPLAGASIIIKGTKTGVATNMDGSYKLENVKENAVLTISYVGYRTMDINTQSKTLVTATLFKEGDILSGEVVVTVRHRKKRKVEVSKTETCTITTTKIYPNPIPSSGILNIAWTNADAGEYNVQISNLQVQVVQVEKIKLAKKQTTSSFSLKNIIAGNYAVIITNTKTDKHFSHQLIVQ